jgi:hypothetical protein
MEEEANAFLTPVIDSVGGLRFIRVEEELSKGKRAVFLLQRRRALTS